MTLTTNPFDDDKLREECGIFGVYGHADSAALTALGLHALQHRGQEAAGIVTYKDGQFFSHRAAGHVGDNFNEESVIGKLPGASAIGHNRYSTTGDTILRNIQPLFADFASGGFAIAHNGNLTNAVTLRRELVERGCLFQSTTDTEVIIHLIATSSFDTVVDRTVAALRMVEGAYSLVALHNDTLIGVRDPYGVRPLVVGRFEDSWILASETCALDIIGAEYIRDIEPGEMVLIDEEGVQSMRPFPERPHKLCIFEYVYFARPDSTMDGQNVYDARKRIGQELAQESGVTSDVVIPVPDSGVPAALGYAEQAGIPYELGIIRNHYVGRTFIEPTDRIRHLGVKLKHNANRDVIEGRRVILVDDSIVRGTTSVKIVEMIRAAGATEVHMRIASPPTTHSCFYGVDTPSQDELLAAKHDVEEMGRIIGVDSLAFLSMDGLYRAMGLNGRNSEAPQYCDACFSGEYPIAPTDQPGDQPSPQLSFLTQLA
ncbi:MAG: amidophosphoribosyltransferase [Pseudomonadota bacterium]|nr:amidophosphoribosyltransferase [Pseudomonadota bacterium]